MIVIIKKLFNFIFSKSKKQHTNSFKKLRNIHRGEDCFIFGDGNSIRSYDLRNFSRNKSFITKYLFTHKQFKYLNFKYSTCIDPFFFNSFINFPLRLFRLDYYKKNLFNNFLFRYLIAKSYKKLILKNKNAFFFISFYNMFFKNKRIYKISEDNNLILNAFFKFSKNQFNFYKSSTRLGLSIANFMGFRNIYLIGFDYLEDYQNQNWCHWYESYSNLGRLNKKRKYENFFFKKIMTNKKSKIILINKTGKHNLLPCISYKNFCTKSHISLKKRDMMTNRYKDIFKLTTQYKI